MAVQKKFSDLTVDDLFQLSHTIDKEIHPHKALELHNEIERRKALGEKSKLGFPTNPRRCISSGLTFFYKFFFPSFWLGGFAFGTIAMLIQGNPVGVIFLLALIVGGLIFWKYDIPLKHVDIDGPDLYISNYRITIRVPLKDISNVTETCWLNNHPVWIHFYSDTEFGNKIMFMPEMKFLTFGSHPVVQELMILSDKHKNE